MPLQPKHLDYANAQFIVIGEASGDLSKATEPQPKDEKHDKDTPLEEMEKLEHEDEIRVEHLKGELSVGAVGRMWGAGWLANASGRRRR